MSGFLIFFNFNFLTDWLLCWFAGRGCSVVKFRMMCGCGLCWCLLLLLCLQSWLMFTFCVLCDLNSIFLRCLQGSCNGPLTVTVVVLVIVERLKCLPRNHMFNVNNNSAAPFMSAVDVFVEFCYAFIYLSCCCLLLRCWCGIWVRQALRLVSTAGLFLTCMCDSCVTSFIMLGFRWVHGSFRLDSFSSWSSSSSACGKICRLVYLNRSAIA